ncbi:MAG: virulence RhuM family protein [Bacteroidales bacterium]|nr:virulence RhuM family protein [Bacteroidales bacterium]MBR4512002.1 virulence RhuM family protein [Bacteroidales bacterium]
MEIHNSIQKNEQPQIKGEIILYQPTEDIRIEARIVYETIWLTQQQISMLFGTKRPAITKHISNIYSSGELDKESTCSILEHMGNEERQRYATMYYNLDIILAVGYRVNSFNATQFRKWATKVLKDYLIKGYSVNNRLERLEQRVTKTEEKIDFFVRTALPPVEGVFYNGQIFDAYVFATDLIKTAKKDIILIDNYIDESVLLMLSKRNAKVHATIITQSNSRTTLLDIEKYNAQYTPIEINNSDFIHDRFLIIDKEVYHIGASLKDLGKKLFAFSKMNISAEMILQMTVLDEAENRKQLK